MAVDSRPVKVAVVGLGYWGPNLARNFNQLEGAELKWCCDGRSETHRAWAGSLPSTAFTTDLDQLLSDPELDAVAIATQVSSHAELATKVLEAGKHCFVEKPLAQSAAEAEAIDDLATSKQLTLMVGHLLQYHPGVSKLKQLIDDGELGEPFYIYSNRLNLGQLRGDENALWSLGAHDVSVLLHLLDQMPVEVSAHGNAYLQEGVEDVVFCHLRFASGVTAHLHLSWLDPHKERRFTVVGAKRMATFDDMELERKVVVYDKGFDRDFSSYGEYITRSGDTWSPRVSNEEPLKLECQHFVDSIKNGRVPVSDGASGVRVVTVLEALQRSLEADGSPISLRSNVGTI